MLNEFWRDAEVISVYTDGDALTDGILIDVSDLQVYFNGKIINRITVGALSAIDMEENEFLENKQILSEIAKAADYDGDVETTWGIVQNPSIAENERFWLVPNDVRGYTLLLPSEY